jgi:hypothetical protein
MTDEEKQAQEQQQQAQQQAEGEEVTPTGTEEKGEKLLPQDEVNRIVQERVNATKEKYADYDDLKAKITEYEKSEEQRKRAEQSELENLQQDVGTKDEELNATKAQLQELQEQIKKDKISRAFEQQASQAGIAYIDDARALADLSNVEVTDEGVKGIDEIVKNLVDNKPFLVKQPEQQRQIGERNNGEQQKHDESNEELLRKAAEKARKSGRLEDKVAYVNLKSELGQ